MYNIINKQILNNSSKIVVFLRTNSSAISKYFEISTILYIYYQNIIDYNYLLAYYLYFV